MRLDDDSENPDLTETMIPRHVGDAVMGQAQTFEIGDPRIGGETSRYLLHAGPWRWFILDGPCSFGGVRPIAICGRATLERKVYESYFGNRYTNGGWRVIDVDDVGYACVDSGTAHVSWHCSPNPEEDFLDGCRLPDGHGGLGGVYCMSGDGDGGYKARGQLAQGRTTDMDRLISVDLIFNDPVGTCIGSAMWAISDERKAMIAQRKAKAAAAAAEVDPNAETRHGD